MGLHTHTSEKGLPLKQKLIKVTLMFQAMLERDWKYSSDEWNDLRLSDKPDTSEMEFLVVVWQGYTHGGSWMRDSH